MSKELSEEFSKAVETAKEKEKNKDYSKEEAEDADKEKHLRNSEQQHRQRIGLVGWVGGFVVVFGIPAIIVVLLCSYLNKDKEFVLYAISFLVLIYTMFVAKVGFNAKLNPFKAVSKMWKKQTPYQ